MLIVRDKTGTLTYSVLRSWSLHGAWFDTAVPYRSFLDIWYRVTDDIFSYGYDFLAWASKMDPSSLSNLRI